MARNLAGAYSGWPIPWPAHTLAGAYPGWRIPWPAHTLAGAYPGQRIPWPAHTLSCLVSCLAWFPILLRLVSCLVLFPVLLGFPLLGFLSCLVSCHAWFLSCFQRPFFPYRRIPWRISNLCQGRCSVPMGPTCHSFLKKSL